MKEINFPRRIVSLVPSQTELLADLGLQEEVVGITKFCVHPAEWFQTKQRVGGTKTVDLEKVAALHPDLILGNKEENERVQIEELQQHFPVWISDVITLEDALEMIRQVGEMTGKTMPAQEMTTEIARRFDALKKDPPKPVRTAYFIWRKPYMVAAGGTFIDGMMRWAGFENVFAGLQRYPEIGTDDLAAAAPEVILLSSEPYPFAEKHLHALRELCPGASVFLVDGEMFSWYGSRLLQAPGYFRELHERINKG